MTKKKEVITSSKKAKRKIKELEERLDENIVISNESDLHLKFRLPNNYSKFDKLQISRTICNLLSKILEGRIERNIELLLEIRNVEDTYGK